MFWLWHPPHDTLNTVFIRRSSGVSSGNACTHLSPGSCASKSFIDLSEKSCRTADPPTLRSARPASKLTAWAQTLYFPGSIGGK